MSAPIHGFHRRRRLNVQHRLFRDLAALILAAAGAILLLGLYTASTVKREVSASLIRETSEAALLEYERASNPVDRFLRIAQGWGEQGLLNPETSADVNRLLIPVLTELPQIAGISIASIRGDSYFLMPDGDGWFIQSRSADSDGMYETSHLDAAGKPLSNERKALEFEALDRPWFEGALAQPEKIYDTAPYTFFTSQLPGITSSIAFTEPGPPENQWIVACDFLLREIGQIVSAIRVGDRGRAFLIRKDGMVFQPPPAGDEQTHSNDYFVPPEKVADPIIRKAVEEWRSAEPLRTSDFRFDADGKKLWAGFNPLESSEKAVWLGVIVAEVDFFGATLHRRRDLLFVGLVILAAAIGLAIVLVRKYRHQLRDLPSQHLSPKTFAEDVLELVREGESATLEFKSTVRLNLAINKPGKEIEIAWLKSVVGFMNTDGGTILLGVNDEGKILGIEPDGFANEDKCRLHLKNLVNEHIGAEFTPYLQFQIGMVDGKMIVAIECERCPRPVFLQAKGKESFFIRSGPSASELSPSEVLKYVKQRE